jgi:radical SAM protein (TIGR01212 family)
MRRYRDFNSYLREIFGERVQRISLDAGLSCPNRDGTISKLGCIYCDRLGSGTGAMIDRGESIEEQVAKGRILAGKRYGARKFIAYFQSFSNTYGPLPKLKEQYDAALSRPDMVGLFVATRPDCIDSDILEALSSYQKDHLVWIEYGLQSAHDSTLLAINRGHDAACFERAARMASGYGLDVCAHVILGLPGETRTMMLETARYLASLPVKGVKIHLLYVVRGTRVASLYERGEFQCLERGDYTELVVDFLELLRPDMIIQRLTGDPTPFELVAPEWAKEKSRNLALIRQRLEERNTWQGKKYQSHGTTQIGRHPTGSNRERRS